ncbi:hypothetical protein CRT60_09910 [Azospirillum palustre]|uniref:LRAT domain-containing protein n=2 Tax=Azospirillum palustre TaxID=2044885 RepID=A0A2B8BHI3_9PROT|nr:hypothetical protein CRT60_09910 [Azospirillum palustre]
MSNVAESFVDNVFRKTVYPKIGSIVYCDLALGFCEHSGVYVGNNEIVHLDGSGYVEIVSPEKFLNRLGGLNTAISIYVSCTETVSVGDVQTATRARAMIGKKRAYNVLLDNCHQFSSGCLTGNFNNTDNFLWMLKDRTRNTLGANSWRVWNRPQIF